MRFTKMQGAGNDYVYVDCFAEPIPPRPAELARRISDRHFGVGSDGLILICPSRQADAQMRMFNADGSEAEMCGNGIRCVAKYLYDHGVCRKTSLSIETLSGIVPLELELDGPCVVGVRVRMAAPILDPRRVPTTLPGDPARPDGAAVDVPLALGAQTLQVTCVSMGNPHAVIFVPRLDRPRRAGTRPADRDRSALSPAGERGIRRGHFPRRGADARLGARKRRNARLRQRGLRGVRGRRLDRADATENLARLPGGELQLHWADDNHVWMTGPAVEVFQGQWEDHEAG